MPRVLIIAYGNPLRSDDGVGWIVAEELRRRLASPEVEVLQLQQLLPEVAESVSRAETVIFVDASCDGEPGGMRCRPSHRRRRKCSSPISSLPPKSSDWPANYMAQLRKPSA